MRLLNTSNLELEWFIDQAHAPRYAILSHTWEDGEVTLQDLTSPDPFAASTLAGFRKIELARRQARRDGVTHVWVDTCCIDKTSSAELTEAINSMFVWYKESAVCYAFLVDLSADDAIAASVRGNALKTVEDGSSDVQPLEPSRQFAGSRWFTRGWTLQELIAPKTVRFYDADWTLRGTKASLASAISTITRIDELVLRGEVDISTLSIAQRMAWAAGRTTTRVEDMAYSLLGIFNVNMPMLYGEGKQAFIRLQEEIMRETNDTSLFAWRAANTPEPQKFRGLLAHSPSEFVDARDVVHGNDPRFDTEFSCTNKGIRINTNLAMVDGRSIFRLNCKLGNNSLGIYLQQHGAGLYARARPDEIAQSNDVRGWKSQGATGLLATLTPVYISKTISPALSDTLTDAHLYGIHLRKGFAFTSELSPSGGAPDDPLGSAIGRVTYVNPASRWDATRELFLTGCGDDFTGLAMVFCSPADSVNLVMGIKNGDPWVSFLIPVAMINPVWDPEQLKNIGPGLRAMKFRGLELEINREVIDGAVVFCIDMAGSLKEGSSIMITEPPVDDDGVYGLSNLF